jgi:hypothetical protein
MKSLLKAHIWADRLNGNPPKTFDLRNSDKKKKKHIKNEFRKTLSSQKILVLLAMKIDTVGITKNKPINTGNTIKPNGNKRKCF